MRLYACLCAVLLASTAFTRPLEILPETKVQEILNQMPSLWDSTLRDIVYDPDTMWYDRTVIIPGYQDSFGDPIGMRPNSIQHSLIDGAVAGGAAQIFIRRGEFHFPFGRTGHPDDATNTYVVDFWRLPREGGRLLPAVHWRRDPNVNTHRIDWMFPEGTVFGEVIFIKDGSGRGHIFEIRTRTRRLDEWTVDVFRPFATAAQLADEVEWRAAVVSTRAHSPSIQNLISHLRNPASLTPASFGGSHFGGAFQSINGAVDELPEIDDPSLWVELLEQTPFRSVKGITWKQNGSLRTWAASSKANFSIVPKNYNAAFFEISDNFCSRCHQDAGRPFRDYYDNILGYGELWGDDENFSWHPFDADYFVNSDGSVKNFNDDNRRFRQDFINAGVLEKYDTSKHSSSRYKKIPRSWKEWKYPAR